MTENQSSEPGAAEPVESAQPAEATESVAPAETVESALPAAPAPAPALPDPSPEAILPPAPGRPVRRGRIAAIVGSALLVVAVIGGVGYTVVTVKGADRDAGAPVWKVPKNAMDDRKAAPAKGLRAMLLPWESSGYFRGPDISEFGADAELSGREATALSKQELGGLPRSERLQLEKEIDREQIKGMAMRSYLNVDYATDSTVAADHAFTIDVVLSQMNEGAARQTSTFQSELLGSRSSFRKGPAIQGHKNAHCFLPPKDSGLKLGAMFCTAYEGDVMVTVTASGAKTMEPKGVAMFVRDQLDRIKTTGQAV